MRNLSPFEILIDYARNRAVRPSGRGEFFFGVGGDDWGN